MAEDKIPNPHDLFFKENWSRKPMAQEFLRHYLDPAVVGLLDLDTLAPTSETFVDPELREYYSDVLYHIKLADATAALIYVLLEHKRVPKRWTACRLLRYLVRVWECRRLG